MEVTFKPSITPKAEEVYLNRSNSKPIVTQEELNIYNEFSYTKNRIPYTGYSEMGVFVYNNIISLLSSAVDKRPKALQIITDKDFLIAMDISNITLNREYTNRFNRVYRAYVINPVKNVIYNQDSANLLYKIALKLNIKLVKILMNIGLSEKNALWLTVNRYSSTDEHKNIRRMVRAMQHIEPHIMTEQMVVDIFSKTFSDKFSNLFITIMTDRFDLFDNDNEKYVYSTVSNALLDILNTMDENDIRDIILEYQDVLRKTGVSGRFSLKSINSGDYAMICVVVDELESIGYDIK